MGSRYDKRKWFVWGILVIAFVAVFFHRLSMGVVSKELIKELGLTGKMLGSLTSMNYYAYALMQIPVGIMVDTIGVRKICAWGTLLTGVGSILFGLAWNVPLAYFSRFIVGIGTSVIIVSILKVQSLWFAPEDYSTLSGYTSFFGNMGALLATFPLAYLTLQIGWRNSFYIMGAVSIILAIGIYVIVRDHPGELGHRMNRRPVQNKNPLLGIRAVLLNPYTWPPFFLMFFMVGTTTAIVGLWGIPYLTHVYGISDLEASRSLSFVSLGFIAGAPLVGKCLALFKGDIKRLLNVATATYTALWLYMAIMGGKPPFNQIPIIFFLVGFCTIWHILAFTNVKEVNDSDFAGSASAIINVGEFIGSSVLSFGIGVLLDFGWKGQALEGARIYDANQYQAVFTLLAVMALISLGATLLIGEKSKTKGDLNEGNSPAL